MVITVNFKGLDETIRYMTNMPKKMDRKLSRTNLKFMEDVRDTARSLAPVDTGHLKSSIILEPVRKGKNVKKWKLVVEADHGIFQEEGFAPHFTFIRNSAKLAPGRYFVKKFTPFIRPALERNINIYLNNLEIAADAALK